VVDVGQHAPEERLHESVAWERTVRDPAVHHHRLHAAAAAFAEKIRPDLRFHHDEEPGLHEVQRTPSDRGPVEGEIKDRVEVAHVPTSKLLARYRRGGEKNLQIGIPAFELGHERPCGEDFSDRDGVDPD
jgi:hypothetical protein